MMRLSAFLLLLIASTASAGTLVVLPFDNVSGSEQAQIALWPLIEKAAGERGWKVVSGDAVESILEARRIRYLDSVDEATRAELASKLGADAILFVTIDAWRDGENPTVAVSSRAVGADGRLLWSDAAAVASVDTERVLQLGRQTTAAAVGRTTIGRLMRKFPRAGQGGRPMRGNSGGPFHRGPRTYRSAALERGLNSRVCILPLDPNGATAEASRMIAGLLAARLSASKDFEVVEPAEFRNAARELSIRSFRNISSTELVALGEKLGTSLFVRGTIFTYRDVPPRATRAFPELQLDLTLTDVKSGRILWAANHSRKGSDYEGLLLRGSVTNMPALADRVISEMIASEEGAKLRKASAVATGNTKGKDNQ